MRPASDYTTDNEVAELEHNSWLDDKCDGDYLDAAAQNTDDVKMIKAVIDMLINEQPGLAEMVKDVIEGLGQPKIPKETCLFIRDHAIEYMRSKL